MLLSESAVCRKTSPEHRHNSDLGQEKDTPFIALEYRKGENLEKTIPRKRELPLVLKVGYIVRICQTLESIGGPHPAAVGALELPGDAGAKEPSL
jgi:hypothetical protein